MYVSLEYGNDSYGLVLWWLLSPLRTLYHHTRPENDSDGDNTSQTRKYRVIQQNRIATRTPLFVIPFQWMAATVPQLR